jgi:hypothetical protein
VIENIRTIVLDSLPGDEETDLTRERREISAEKTTGRRITRAVLVRLLMLLSVAAS